MGDKSVKWVGWFFVLFGVLLDFGAGVWSWGLELWFEP